MKTKESEGFNPWPIGIVAYFVCFIVATIIFIAFALRNSMDLVRSDYYEQEIRYENQMDRMRLGEGVSDQVSVDFDGDANSLILKLPVAHIGRIASGTVHFYRPSNAKWDRHMPLILDASGRQSLDVSGMQSGFWKIRLQWMVEGKEFYLDRSLMIEPSRSS